MKKSKKNFLDFKNYSGFSAPGIQNIMNKSESEGFMPLYYETFYNYYKYCSIKVYMVSSYNISHNKPIRLVPNNLTLRIINDPKNENLEEKIKNFKKEGKKQILDFIDTIPQKKFKRK